MKSIIMSAGRAELVNEELVNEGERRGKRPSMPRIALMVMGSLFACFAFTLNFAPDTSMLQNIGPNSIVLQAFLLGVFLAISYVVARLDKKIYVSLIVIGLVISAVWVAGLSFVIDNTTNAITCSKTQVVKSCIFFLGYAYFLVVAGKCFNLFTQNNNHATKSLRIFKYKHAFLLIFAIVFLCWLPWIIMGYPCCINYDPAFQLSQYFGMANFTSHQPPVSTVLLGLSAQVGLCMGNVSYGLFLYVLVQSIVFACVISYLFITMNRFNSPRWLFVFVGFCVVFCPVYFVVSTITEKDIPYSIFFLLFCIELVYLAKLQRSYFASIKHILLMSVALLGVITLRNNGGYIVFVVLVVLAILGIWQKCVANKRNKVGREFQACENRAYASKVAEGKVLAKDNSDLTNGNKVIVSKIAASKLSSKQKHPYLVALALFLVPCLIANASIMAIMRVHNGAPGPQGEMFSIPFQQTGRYLHYHADDVTDEEWSVLADTFNDYRDLGNLYVPLIADPVKFHFINKEENNIGRLAKYFTLYARMGLRHPKTYLDAFINQNYPVVSYSRIKYLVTTTQPDEVDKLYNRNDVFKKDPGYLFSQIKNKGPLQNLRERIINLFYQIPGISLLCQSGIYVLIVLWLCAFALRKKHKKFLFASLPVLLSIGVVLVSPTVFTRYCLPHMYATLPLLVFYVSLCADKSNIDINSASEHIHVP